MTMVPIDAARLPEGAPGRWSKVQPGMYAAVRYPVDPVARARLVLWPYKGTENGAKCVRISTPDGDSWGECVTGDDPEGADAGCVLDGDGQLPSGYGPLYMFSASPGGQELVDLKRSAKEEIAREVHTLKDMPSVYYDERGKKVMPFLPHRRLHRDGGRRVDALTADDAPASPPPCLEPSTPPPAFKFCQSTSGTWLR